MKSIILAVAMIASTTPPTEYVMCHCPLGHTSYDDYWDEHEDDGRGVIPPIAWWGDYFPTYRGPQK